MTDVLLADPPALRERVRIERPRSFDTGFMGLSVEDPVIKNMDWLEKHRSDAHILRSIKSYLARGVRSRKERFGEFGGRFISGYWREPQSEIHVHVPANILGDSISTDPRDNWQGFFKNRNAAKHGYPHRMYVLIDTANVRRDTYKDRYDIVPDDTTLGERRVQAFFIRSELFKWDVLLEIIDSVGNTPLIDVQTLERII
ncbi:MAG: hypothetical protein ABA06_01155 [Parcubacteria bacterium C7867-001]|nr:MAG: hypothetical protein ABA06_01155 [Parcubacteria bacterium C7867-001]